MKVMTPDEFAEWASKHTLAEVEEAAIEQNAHLRDELLEIKGHTTDEYLAASPDAQTMLLEEGAQVWVDDAQQKQDAEEAEQRQEYAKAQRDDEEGQLRTQMDFAARHPLHFPSETNAQLFESEYVAAFKEANPGIAIFWDSDVMEGLYAEMAKNNEFPITRQRIFARKSNDSTEEK